MTYENSTTSLVFISTELCVSSYSNVWMWSHRYGWPKNNQMRSTTSFEMRCYRGALRISWKDKRSVLEELDEKWLLNSTRKRKLSSPAHAYTAWGPHEINNERHSSGKQKKGLANETMVVRYHWCSKHHTHWNRHLAWTETLPQLPSWHQCSAKDADTGKRMLVGQTTPRTEWCGL